MRLRRLGERAQLPRARHQEFPEGDLGFGDRGSRGNGCERGDSAAEGVGQEDCLRHIDVRLPLPLRRRRDRPRGLPHHILRQVRAWLSVWERAAKIIFCYLPNF